MLGTCLKSFTPRLVRSYSAGYPCINKAQLLGEVVEDPVIRTVADDLQVANFSICTYERRTKKDGGIVDLRTWHKIKTFNKATIDIVKSDVQKGTWVFAEGRITRENWVNQEGQKQYMTMIDISKGDLQVVASGSSESGEEAAKASA